jgi:quinol monooxygenase YgiN
VSTLRRKARKDERKLPVKFVAGVRKERGCKHASLLEDRKQAGGFLTFEIRADQAAIEAHMTTPRSSCRPDANPPWSRTERAGRSPLFEQTHATARSLSRRWRREVLPHFIGPRIGLILTPEESFWSGQERGQRSKFTQF